MKHSFFLMLGFMCTLKAWPINLFNAEYYRPLIADKKASLPGDLLTVIVLENANAQSSADLNSSKELKSSIEIGYNKNNHEVDLGLKGKGKTTGKTGRYGKIKASLTVHIKEVFPNTTYFIEGVQAITINGEKQTILVNGIVRPEDISPQNTILSTRVENAQITYTGEGSVSNTQTRNHLYKLLSYMGFV